MLHPGGLLESPSSCICMLQALQETCSVVFSLASWLPQNLLLYQLLTTAWLCDHCSTVQAEVWQTSASLWNCLCLCSQM